MTCLDCAHLEASGVEFDHYAVNINAEIGCKKGKWDLYYPFETDEFVEKLSSGRSCEEFEFKEDSL